MDIYQQRSNWKIILAVFGLIILGITIVYANYLANQLKQNELKNAKLFRDAMEYVLNNPNTDQDIQIQDYIVNTFPQPVILKDENGVYAAMNFPKHEENDQEFLKMKIEEFKKSGQKPLAGTGYASEIYFFNSPLLGYIRYFPIVQIFLVGSFIALGYYLFNSSKKAEQSRVWAGMAKETAHQLGTPISAIMGWVNHLKENYNHDEELNDISGELEKDVDRLNLIADRFSKIGSAPKLDRINLETDLLEVMDYIKRRASQKINFLLEKENIHKSYFSNVNSHLFVWVIENLMRNSLDAMNESGEIKVRLYQEDQYNCIDISDTGKGIPTSKFKTIFNPGYSTKQRGWGLGLSLAKRIIEEYHNGKIYVKSSRINEGTTFTIKLKSLS